MADETDFKRAFDRVFFVPSSRVWKSARGRPYWVELEGWQASIAGPLYSIVENGGCEYVYARTDRAFTGVHNPESLRRSLLAWHAALVALLEKFVLASEAEEADMAFMRSNVAELRSLIDRAVEVESRRRGNR